MGRFVLLGALAGLYLGAESKALRWQDDTPSWSPPKETIAAMDMMELGLSPVPTAAPDPASVELKLAKRVRGDDTCGYISGISTDSIYCGVGSCVINSFYSVVGCCASSSMSDCKIATACLPSSSSRFYTSSDTLMRYCSSSAQPECITYVYSDAIFSKYTLYDCATSEKRVIVYANPTDSAAANPRTTAPVIDESSVVPSPVSSTATPGPITTTAAPAPGGGGGSSTPVGAIVGGVVGGVAAIALIVFGIIFLLRKKKKDDPNNNLNGQAHPVMYNPQQPQLGHQQQQQPPPPQMYQTTNTQQSSPGYAPNGAGNFPSGFTPVPDNRQSMLKQPYDVTAAGYDHNGHSPSPPASPPPMSPSPTYQSGVPSYTPSSLGNGGPSPTQAGYPTPQQQQQQQQPPQQGYYAPPAQTQHQQTTKTTHHGHQSFASELPATRGDGELRELA
ncbi:hypothetical protein CkaCkLH20_01423 [Colletotrichum karsti]|uniref:Carcinoembryonic antigen-related cell adhesion molecule 1 n=1 Tax=Colletotrichum karsti TaxID=1095194 RepID=A0A9P6ICX0_9PEZI|nr:uncharacterized protein CkaCkLH20_01423 [Colletotrichum karsti]KAF9881273.1 hypothetical protein CkaCkLH20_01423 [Colletotrichum karsti]